MEKKDLHAYAPFKGRSFLKLLDLSGDIVERRLRRRLRTPRLTVKHRHELTAVHRIIRSEAVFVITAE